MKKFLSLLVVSIMVAGLTACGGTATPASSSSSPTPTPSQSQQSSATPAPTQQSQAPTGKLGPNGEELADVQDLAFAMTVDAPSLDQQKASSSASFSVGRGIYEGLVRLENGVTPMPGIAESWEISDDGMKVTFHLRDAKWSDGSPITAHDFEFGLKRLLDPETATPYAFQGYIVKGALAYNEGKGSRDDVGVKAIDDKTLEYTLEYSAPYFIPMVYNMQYYPVKEEFVKAQGEKFAQEPENMLYNGPFVLKEWKHEEYLLLEKNPNYWNADAIYLNTVKIYVVPGGTNTALDMYNDGQLSYVDIPSTAWVDFKDDPNVQLFADGAVDWLSIKHDNADEPWLANQNFRMALNYAVDREDYCLLASNGLLLPGTRLVLPDVSGVNKPYYEEYPIEGMPTTADPAKAKEYLDKALAELNLTDPKQITVTLLTTDSAGSKLQAEILQDMFITNLGINFEIQLVTYAEKLKQDQGSNYSLVFKGWMPDYDDPMTYLELFQTGNGEASLHWFNKEYDDKVEAARHEGDPTKRMQLMADAEKLTISDAAFVPLQVRRRAWMKNDKLMNLPRNFMVSEDFVYAYFVK